MEQGGDALQLCCVNACVVEDFVDVGTAAAEHVGEGHYGEALAFHFGADALSDVQSFHSYIHY